MDRASAKRGWQATLAELKQRKPARYQWFASVEVDVDSDGATLVLEFPSDSQMALDMASEPDNRELVRGALAAVFGFAPAFRYQLGRGAVRPAAAQPLQPTVESAPFEEPAPSAVVERDPEGGDDLEDLLTNELGAQIVSEHPAQPAEATESVTAEDAPPTLGEDD
jgi:hypothetical protein